VIVVRVELVSAITGQTTELARAVICNTGAGTAERGDYRVSTLRGRCKADLDAALVAQKTTREGEVRDFPRQRLHVWNLVADALKAMGYGRGKP
jgi:hypothetical protein